MNTKVTEMTWNGQKQWYIKFLENEPLKIVFQQNHFKKPTSATCLDKNGGTCNLIFCCFKVRTAINHCVSEASAPVNRDFAPLQGKLSEFWRASSPDGIFQLLDVLLNVEGQFRTVRCFALSHRWEFLAEFCVTILLEDTRQCISLQNAPLRFHFILHRFERKQSKAAREHNPASSMFDSRDCDLF